MIRRLLSTIALATLLGCHPAPTLPDPPPVASEPHLRIGDRSLDAGVVDNGAAVEKSFLLANTGGRPLHLTLVSRSCSCNDVIVPEAVAPGASAAVTCHWTPAPAALGPTTLAAEFTTDDPATPRLRLELKADVRPLIRLFPRHIPFVDFGPIRRGQVIERTLTIFSIKLPSFSLATSTTGGSPLDINAEPLPAGFAVEDETARSGYRIILRTTDRLPPGYLRDDLVLTATPPGGSPRRFVLPLYGAADNDRFQVSPEEIAFTKPLVTDADSRTVIVQFLAPTDDDVLEIVRVEPGFLKTTPPAQRVRGRWEFRVLLPADQAEAKLFQPDKFFEGRVILRARGGPETQVRVKWRPE